jgi:hypothetical protein
MEAADNTADNTLGEPPTTAAVIACLKNARRDVGVVCFGAVSENMI